MRSTLPVAMLRPAVFGLTIGATAVASMPAAVATPMPRVFGELPNRYVAAVCVSAGGVACGLAYTSSQAAMDDTFVRYGPLAAEHLDGNRANAFLHSSWNARMAVLIGRSWAQSFSTAHERPITSANPAGTNHDNRHERMDLCNNRRGANRPSNWEIITLNQMSAVNRLYHESRAMAEDGNRPEALLSHRACDGSILVFVRKDNGTWFG